MVSATNSIYEVVGCEMVLRSARETEEGEASLAEALFVYLLGGNIGR